MHQLAFEDGFKEDSSVSDMGWQESIQVLVKQTIVYGNFKEFINALSKKTVNITSKWDSELDPNKPTTNKKKEAEVLKTNT